MQKRTFFKLIFSLIVRIRAPQGISITRHATVLVIVRTTPLNTHLYGVSYCLGVVRNAHIVSNFVRLARHLVIDGCLFGGVRIIGCIRIMNRIDFGVGIIASFFYTDFCIR